MTPPNSGPTGNEPYGWAGDEAGYQPASDFQPTAPYQSSGAYQDPGAYQQPGYPMAGVPGADPSKRPGQVLAVIIIVAVCTAFVVLDLFLEVAGVATGVSRGFTLTITILELVVNGVLLWGLTSRPGKPWQIATTVVAGLWCLSIIGIVVAVPVIVLLWLDASRRYFAACDAARTGTPGAGYPTY